MRQVTTPVTICTETGCGGAIQQSYLDRDRMGVGDPPQFSSNMILHSAECETCGARYQDYVTVPVRFDDHAVLSDADLSPDTRSEFDAASLGGRLEHGFELELPEHAARELMEAAERLGLAWLAQAIEEQLDGLTKLRRERPR